MTPGPAIAGHRSPSWVSPQQCTRCGIPAPHPKTIKLYNPSFAPLGFGVEWVFGNHSGFGTLPPRERVVTKYGLYTYSDSQPPMLRHWPVAFISREDSLWRIGGLR